LFWFLLNNSNGEILEGSEPFKTCNNFFQGSIGYFITTIYPLNFVRKPQREFKEIKKDPKKKILNEIRCPFFFRTFEKNQNFLGENLFQQASAKRFPNLLLLESSLEILSQKTLKESLKLKENSIQKIFQNEPDHLLPRSSKEVVRKAPETPGVKIFKVFLQQEAFCSFPLNFSAFDSKNLKQKICSSDFPILKWKMHRNINWISYLEYQSSSFLIPFDPFRIIVSLLTTSSTLKFLSSSHFKLSILFYSSLEKTMILALCFFIKSNDKFVPFNSAFSLQTWSLFSWFKIYFLFLLAIFFTIMLFGASSFSFLAWVGILEIILFLKVRKVQEPTLYQDSLLSLLFKKKFSRFFYWIKNPFMDGFIKGFSLICQIYLKWNYFCSKF